MTPENLPSERSLNPYPLAPWRVNNRIQSNQSLPTRPCRGLSGLLGFMSIDDLIIKHGLGGSPLSWNTNMGWLNFTNWPGLRKLLWPHGLSCQCQDVWFQFPNQSRDTLKATTKWEWPDQVRGTRDKQTFGPWLQRTSEWSLLEKIMILLLVSNTTKASMTSREKSKNTEQGDFSRFSI